MKRVSRARGLLLLALCVALAGCSTSKTVPDVAGQTQAAASSTIVGAGLVVGTIAQVYSDTVAMGLVVSQTPAAGTSVKSGSAVDLVVSQGPQPVTVPNVAGMTQAVASAVLVGAGLTVGTITQAYSATVATGLVISQTPASGSSASAGAAVDLVLSRGPQPVTVAVPNVAGMNQATATTVLVGAGLVVGTITQDYSASVAVGSVISQTPTAGALVSPGAAVNLVVSKGVQPVIVPDVLGMTQSEAGTALTNALLALGAVTRLYSPTIPTGEVMEEHPAAGTSVAPGTAVDLGISKGPEFVLVPNVVGLTQTAAGTALSNALLSLGAVTQLYSATVPVGQVMQENPAAGASVAPGTAVDLGVSKGP